MSQSIRALLVRCIALVAIAWSPSPLGAQHQAPIVEITPRGQLITDPNRNVAVTVKLCHPWGGVGWQWYVMRLNGADITSQFSWTGGGQDAQCDSFDLWSATLTLAENTHLHHFSASIMDVYGYLGQDEVYYAIPSKGRAILVASTAGFASPAPGTPASQQFTIWNAGDIGSSYSFSAICTGAASGCSVTPNAIWIGNGSSATATVSYSVSATVGDTGLVKLRAVDLDESGVAGEGWTEVTVKAAPTPGLVLATSHDFSARAGCVSVALRPDVMSQCGDLVITHPLPTVKTMGKARTPTLLYNSRTATPSEIFAGDVTVPAGTLPATVDVYAYVAGIQRGYRQYPGSDWGSGGSTRRVAVPALLSMLTTSLYSYQLLVVLNWPGGGNTQYSASGWLTFVSRDRSPFGAGWWLAGLGELIDISVDHAFLVDGDGSTRLYTRDPATTTSAGSTYRALGYTRPDSLVMRFGIPWVRRLADGTEVRYDYYTGRQLSTTTPTGQVTTFAYVPGTKRVESITVPRRGGGLQAYTFAYDANGVLSSVTAVGQGQSRTVTTTRNAWQITAITDPDSRTVQFAYGIGGYIITNRTDRRNFSTAFTFDPALRLTGSSMTLPGGQVIAHTLRAAETRGVAGTDRAAAQPLDSVFALIDGPRTDVVDITKIWVNRFGAPTRIRNAEGRETQLTYDASWPGRVKQSRSPSRLLTVAFHSAVTGLVDSMKVHNPTGAGQTATTRYAWDAKWSAPTSIVSPTGLTTEFHHDPANGNRLWEQVGGSARRVTYGYDGFGQLTSVTPPGIAPTIFAYNTLGNAWEVTSPKGYKTYALQNGIGQDTLAASPFSDTTTAGSYSVIVSQGSRTRTWYDDMGRVRGTTSYGPAVTTPHNGTVPADSLKVEHLYDEEGNVTSTTRRFWLNGCCGSGHIYQSSWSYDGAGRMLSESSPGTSKSFAYDPAGNAIAVTNGRNLTVTTTYDALNRMSRRVVPQVDYGSTSCWVFFSYCYWSFPTVGGSLCINADTARFFYDQGGNLVRADNRYARVRRAFSQAGYLLRDTLIIRAYAEPGDTPCTGAPPANVFYGGMEWTRHVHVLESVYDMDGRRVELRGPAYFSGCLANPCRTTWSFDGTTGNLQSVTDGLGRAVGFTYDNADRLTDITFPGGIIDHRVHDAEGRIVERTVGSNVFDDRIAFDAAGRLARATVGYRSGTTFGQPVENWYGPLGALIATSNTTTSASGGVSVEKFTVDALGNRRWTQQTNIKPSYHPDVNGTRDLTIDGLGRLTNVVAPYHYYYSYNKEIEHDGSGNVATTKVIESDYYASGSLWDASKNYYDAGDRLRAFNRHIGPGAVSDDSRPGQRGVFEEYFYDALGRRVAVRSRRGSACNVSGDAECSSYVERTVWDGDQIVYEVRSPGGNNVVPRFMESDESNGPAAEGYPYGQVGYVHAGGIDQPVAVLRGGMDWSYQPALVTVYPHQNWRGVFELGSLPSGQLTSTCGGGAFGCPPIAWPGASHTADGAVGSPSASPSWFGSLIPNKADGSGMQYMRNRYYDPQTGRFTQEDPIGLAGGMNLYGFAGGDPVNFSDPFGLCPIPADDFPPGYFTALGTAAGALLGGAGGGAGGFFGGGGVAAVPGAMAGARLGAALGGAIGAFVDGVAFANDAGRTASGGYTDEHGNELGPSGKPKHHSVDHASKKAAKDAARNQGKRKPVKHASPHRGKPHYHPTDADGEKVPGSTHHTYPKP